MQNCVIEQFLDHLGKLQDLMLDQCSCQNFQTTILLHIRKLYRSIFENPPKYSLFNCIIKILIQICQRNFKSVLQDRIVWIDEIQGSHTYPFSFMSPTYVRPYKFCIMEYRIRFPLLITVLDNKQIQVLISFFV